ncbi:hypothetical protein [Ideonella sp. YS5]|uniref:hypothetical protein n=1 Tax=Ideonella sp. YS5 TaxID=3453714 RepID=UPI003EEAD652
MKITPTPVTAALAGIAAAVGWPFLWSRFGGPSADGSVELIVGTLLVVALPAHAFVVGFGRSSPSAAGSLDIALLKRIGAWLVAAAATAALGRFIQS